MSDYFFGTTEVHTTQLGQINPLVWGASVISQTNSPNPSTFYGYGASETEALVNALQKSNIPPTSL